MQEFDLTNEDWREYDLAGRVYRIDEPDRVFISENGSTHRVLDKGGVFHVCPAPGRFGCALRFKNGQSKPDF